MPASKNNNVNNLFKPLISNMKCISTVLLLWGFLDGRTVLANMNKFYICGLVKKQNLRVDWLKSIDWHIIQTVAKKLRRKGSEGCCKLLEKRFVLWGNLSIKLESLWKDLLHIRKDVRLSLTHSFCI